VSGSSATRWPRCGPDDGILGEEGVPEQLLLAATPDLASALVTTL
jgi:hypothetical protein